MFVETVTKIGNVADAEDNLAGVICLPGFVFGYVRLPRTTSQHLEVVTVFNIQEGELSNTQREVHQYLKEDL